MTSHSSSPDGSNGLARAFSDGNYSFQGPDRPTLNFENPADGETVTIAFGYLRGEATAAVFHGDELVLIPRDVLIIAFEQGWGKDE